MAEKIDRKRMIPRAPIEKLMKNVAKKYEVTRVSRDASNEMVEALENIAVEIMESAVRLAKHAGTNTVNDEDIKMAVK